MGGTGGIGLDDPAQSQATLHDPQFEPSFLGLVVSLGDEELSHAFSFGYVSPINMQLYWMVNVGAPTVVGAISEQQSSRFRFSYAVDLKLADDQKGWFTHIAVGGGIDWGSTVAKVTIEDPTTLPPLLYEVSDRESRFGFGVGFLLTLYDNGDGLSVDLGASYNSELDFEFNVPTTGPLSAPFMAWPAEWSAGIALYISRLKLTAAYQAVLWEDAAAPTTLGASFAGFQDASSMSFGLEYALHVNDEVTAFLRVGARQYDAPWDEDTLMGWTDASTVLPVSVDQFALSIEPDDEEYTMGTVGAGIYWTVEGGKLRGFDFGLEFGGDKVTLAVGYVHEF
jgi:hypothetical protein